MENPGNEHIEKAERKAEKIAGNKDRLQRLVGEVTNKIGNELRDKFDAGKLKGRLHILIRMIRAYINGDYKLIPWKVLVSLAAALIYFVTPLDLIPDFIPITGYIDDFTVILWVFKSFQSEINDFIDWEKERLNISSEE